MLKADVHGSCEAVRDALMKLATDTVKVNVILSGVGAISEGDVMLAKASDAIVVGFHVRPDPAARRAAEGQGVDLRSYQIIYELTDEVRAGDGRSAPAEDRGEGARPRRSAEDLQCAAHRHGRRVLRDSTAWCAAARRRA